MPLIALPALTDNYIWMHVNAMGQAIVIDPGDAAPVIAACSQGIHPIAILLTHHHADHVGGVAGLRAHYPSIRVYGPEHPQIFADVHVGEGDVIHIKDREIQVIAVPGHTQSHLAYYDSSHLFCGDTLFSLGCGRVFDGTVEALYMSLQRLCQLPGATRVCCGHEYTQANALFATHVDAENPALQHRCRQIHSLRQTGQATLPVSLTEELATNPFLRCHAPAIQSSVLRQFGQECASELAVFIALRFWKDQFRS